MTEIELPYLNHFVDRHGHLRWYFRRYGKRTPLKGQPGTIEFADSYAAALNDQTPTRPSHAGPVGTGTFRALAISYFASPKYLGLSQSSRVNYKRVIDSFCAEHGHRLVKQFTAEHVDIIIGRMADRPGAGIVLLKRIRTLCRHAIRPLRWISNDPTVGAKSYRSKEIHTWTEEELTTFEGRWAVGTKQRLAYAMLLYTGQRGSDAHRMVWPDIAGDTIRVVQQKTDQEEADESLVIPLHPQLQEILSATRRTDVAILVTEYGKQFSVKGFGNYVSDAISAAGLPVRCKAHGLRKAAARRLAEAGCTEKQIMAITGHKTMAEVERYTRAADQKRLARQAIEKQVGNTELATPNVRLATRDKNW